MSLLRVRAYILAGGKSSRMGQDKAMLELGGKTLLARAVGMLRDVRGLRAATGEVIVSIAGERQALEGADRSIADRFPGCGPLGGIEAALDDLERGDTADWALFIPVDMPLLRAELMDSLLSIWTNEISSNSSVRACLVEVGGRPQPLVSLVHHAMLGEVREALEAGRYKVIPVLQSDVACCTSLGQDDSEVNVHPINLCETLSHDGTSGERWKVAVAAARAERKDSSLTETSVQFTNVNTEADLLEVATLIKRLG